MRVFYILAVLPCLWGACQTPYQYMPHTQQVPLFREKHEARAALVASLPEEDISRIGMAFQGAYAAGKHVGITASIMHEGYNTMEESFTPNATQWQKWNYTHYELGAGYFRPVGRNMIFEAYGGGGLVKISDWKRYYHNALKTYINDKTQVFYQQYYLQPVVGYAGPYFEAAFSTRFTMHYLDHSTTNQFGQHMQGPGRNHFSWFAEPALTIRFGEEYIKIQVQLIWSQPIRPVDYPRHWGQTSIGLVGIIGQKWYRKNQQAPKRRFNSFRTSSIRG